MCGRSAAHRVKSFFHCWLLLLLVAAAAVCDKATAQGTVCGTVDPDQVDRIPEANIQQNGLLFLVIGWAPPDYDYNRGYSHILRCATCPNGTVNLTDPDVDQHRFEGLQPATEYNISIQAAYQNCSLSPPFDLVGRTVLSDIPGTVLISNVTQTSLRAEWAPSPDVGVQYRVSCAGDVNTNSTMCYGLLSGSKIQVLVHALKTGFPEGNRIFSDAFTKLYPIDASSATYSVSETTVSVSWNASVTDGVRYQLICSRSGSSDVIEVNSSSPSAICSPLQSGQAYELSVAVQKDGGFEDISTSLTRQLTKLFAIEASSAGFNATETSIFVSWAASATEGVTYRLSCNNTFVPSNDSFATCHSLQSGQVYAVTVTVLKQGYPDAVTHLPNQLTKLFAIDASSASTTANETAINVTWEKSQTPGVTYELSCSRSGSSDVIKIKSSGLSATCSPLQSGQAYELSVAVQKEVGFDDAVTRLSPALTKLFAIDASSARVNASQTSIFVSWNPSVTTDVTYLLTCAQQGSGAVANGTSSDPFATCDSLQSGEKFSLRLAVQKAGGYVDAVTELPDQLTRLFSVNSSSAIYSVNATAISVSWLASVTQRVSYQLRCRRSADEAVLRNVSLTDEPRLSATCDSLAPGQVYSLDLTVWKEGGYETVMSDLDSQLTVPLLSSDPQSTFGTVADSVALNDSHAEAVLRLNWTASAAQGADRFNFRAWISATDTQVESEVQFQQLQHVLSSADLFSGNVTLTVIAVANKSNLIQRSPELTIAAGLATPPKRPLMSLTPDKRAIEVTLTASSSSDVLRATALTGSEAAAGTAASCRPDASSGSCTVRVETLRPYSNYTVESVAEYSALSSLPLRSVIQTMEDAPTQPQSVSLSVESLPERLLCEWLPPSELNGVIRNYSAVWGLLDFASGAEMPADTKVAAGGQTSQQLLQSPLPGHEYFCRVGACTGGGCGDFSDRAKLRLPDGASSAVSEVLSLPIPGRGIGFNWTTLDPVEAQGVVFEYALRVDGADGCATARKLNCSDCGRHRQQLPSEALQRLEQLTSDCAQTVPLQAFSIRDSRLTLEVPVSSRIGDSSSLLPWTEYNATLWPVNLAGPGAALTISFRSPEAPSGPVRSLRATPQQTEALVEFQEPAQLNGLLMAFAVQVWDSPSSCSQLQVLNSSTASCQLPSCSTADILSGLAGECGSVRTGELQIVQASSNESAPLLSVKLQQLRAGTEYTLRVTAVSQSVSGDQAELIFTTAGGGGGGNLGLVVAIVVSVVVVMAIVAGMLLFIWNRRRKSFRTNYNATAGAIRLTPSSY